MFNRTNRILLISFILLILLVTGCTQTATLPAQPEAVTDTPTLEPTTQLPPSDTPTPEPPTSTPTEIPPTETPVPTETPTSPPTDTAAPTETPTATLRPISYGNLPKAVPDSVRIFFILPDSGGTICGDSLISVGTDIKKTGRTAEDVKAALTKLFSFHSEYIGSFYNPVHAVNFKVKKVTLDQSGHLDVRLAGSFDRTSDKCENDRLKSQIWSTFRQFGRITSYQIWINNVLLGDLISND
jgi:hypothetical protein